MNEFEKNAEQASSSECSEWQSIDLKINEAAVHVKNDAVLKQCMGYHLSNALRLSEEIKKQYEKEFHTALRITTISLAVELEGHFLIQEICLKIKKVMKRVPFHKPTDRVCDWFIRHMDVIDCGEKHCDNNRFLWDMCSYPIGAIWRMKNLRKKK